MSGNVKRLAVANGPNIFQMLLADSLNVIVVSGRTEKLIPVTVPHTITDWVGSGFCVSSRSGVGVSDEFKVTAFQPFFVSMTLPYSLVRAERVAVPVSVFNYLTTGCLHVRTPRAFTYLLIHLLTYCGSRLFRLLHLQQ